MNESQMVISALGQDRPGIVKILSKTVLDCGGNISDSRMTRLGEEFAMIMLVEGSDGIIAAIEKHLKTLQDSESLIIISKRTVIKPLKEQFMPYLVNVVCMDQPGIVHDITDFVASRQINIEKLDTSSYAAAHTGAPMFALDMTISIPASTNTAEFKLAILNYCDDLNLDVTVEPIK